MELADLDDVCRARWSASISADGSRPALSKLARVIRYEIEPEMPADSPLREAERESFQAFLSAVNPWDAKSYAPTPMLLTVQRPTRLALLPRPMATVEPEPAVLTAP